jgi:uncharacterized LabA/DUF88 family protein
MEKKVCVFVDGENFRKSIVKLFDDFKTHEYLPDTDWGTVFDWFVQQTEENCERIRTYWYVIEYLEFFPYGLRKASKNPNLLRSILSKHRPYADELDSLEGDDLQERMNSIVDEFIRKRNKMRSRFEGWTNVQNNIASRYRAIEFRRAGVITYNLFTCKLGREKAVDVKLATDLIILRDVYDLAVIISGDQDFVPAVKAMKDFGKRVVNIAFETRGGKLLPGGARRLNQVTDWSLRIQHDDLSERLFPK